MEVVDEHDTPIIIFSQSREEDIRREKCYIVFSYFIGRMIYLETSTLEILPVIELWRIANLEKYYFAIRDHSPTCYFCNCTIFQYGCKISYKMSHPNFLIIFTSLFKISILLKSQNGIFSSLNTEDCYWDPNQLNKKLLYGSRELDRKNLRFPFWPHGRPVPGTCYYALILKNPSFIICYTFSATNIWYIRKITFWWLLK